MSPGHNVAFSSSLLRERDQKILEKHAREKAELEFRIQKVKKVNDERAKELFDALHRGDRLARSIGFDNLYEAQIYLDSLDHSTAFKECMDRIRILEAELTCEKKEVEILQVKLNKVEDNSRLQAEFEKLKTEFRSVTQCSVFENNPRLIQVFSNSERHHREELKQLQERYDSLKAAKERANERYKADFKKWRDFNNWLFAENDEHHKRRNEPGISKEEKKRRDLENVMRKRQKMIEIGPDLARFEGEAYDLEGQNIFIWSKFMVLNYYFCIGFRHPPPIGCTELEADKENDATTSPPPQKNSHSISDRQASRTSLSRPLRDTQLKDVSTSNVNVDLSSSSPAFFSTKGPSATSTLFPFRLDPIHIKQDPDTTPTNVGRRTAKRAHMPSSSDTEEDSQGFFLFFWLISETLNAELVGLAVPVPSTNPRSGKLAVFKVPPPPVASSNRSSGESTLLSIVQIWNKF
jgi:hypothetical protein